MWENADLGRNATIERRYHFARCVITGKGATQRTFSERRFGPSTDLIGKGSLKPTTHSTMKSSVSGLIPKNPNES